ncbi:MAG: hypothetical protein SGBAC_006676 [Bacillariaceae sp.]
MMSLRRNNLLLLLSVLFLACQCVVVNCITLLGGRFETTTDVHTLLNLALDAAEMKESDDFDTKRAIYTTGVSRENEASLDISLAELSLRASGDMLENPYFHIFRHAFLVLGNAEENETEGRFDGAAIEQYGNTLVNDLFDLDVDGIETEAAIVLNVWMAVINELFQVKIQCRANNMNMGLAALDKAAAMWIGEGQDTGVNDSGHMLYSLAENAGERFDQDNGETVVNSKIVDLFVEIQKDLRAGKCADLTGYLNVRGQIRRMVSLMTIPLIQNLIHHTMNVSAEHGADWVELYALASIPRIAVCSPEDYDQTLHLNVLREMTPEYANQALAALERSYSCFGITCADVGSYRGGERPQCEDVSGVNLVGYTSSREDIREKSYLDRDIKTIDVLMKFKAYGLALDWYEYGWNSVYNLQGLAKNEVIPNSSKTGKNMFATFANYYGGDDFADKYVYKLMNQQPPYNAASTEQTRWLLTNYFSKVVMYVAATSAFQYAVDQCETDTETALDYWDTGAMFYIGSMEGELPEGNTAGGLLLFSTAKDLCEEFGTCIDDSEVGGSDIPRAMSNELLVASLNQGLQRIESQQCDFLENILTQDMLGVMPIPIIQGTVKYASFISNLPAGSDAPSLAIADAYSKGILPLVDEADATSAGRIQTAMEFSLTDKPGDVLIVVEALKTAIPKMNIDCSQIGDFIDESGDAGLCVGGGNGNPTAPGGGSFPVAAPTRAPLPVEPGSAGAVAWGRFSFSTPSVALGDAKFALDVRAMYEAADIAAATSVYTVGLNAVTKNLNGTTGLVSLKSLSIDSSAWMGQDPLFNVFKWALYDDKDVGQDSQQNFQYADDVIQEALTNGNDMRLAAEGSVIFNVWMLMAHRLYEAVRVCKQQQAPLEQLDSVVALWIGESQAESKYDNGWMLYSIGQSAAEYYGFDEAEAPINTELMHMFNKAQDLAQQCPAGADAVLEFRAHVLHILRRLTVPLVTSLLFHMVSNSKNMVELYAVSVVPQVYNCDGDAAVNLESVLYQGYTYNAVDDDTIGDISTFLRCKRITCQDIRVSENLDNAKLKDLVGKLCEKLDYWDNQGMELPMAGYIPSKDVSEISRLDLDILEIEMLAELGAFPAAQDIYENGHHSFAKPDGSLRDLQSIARMSSLDEMAKFHLYSEYYGSLDFADKLILNALNQSGDYVEASWQERSEIVSRSLQTTVAFMAVQARMQEAVDDCTDGKAGLAELKWNEAAAFWIGSAEGLVAASKFDVGRFMYSLANDVCGDFQACAENSESLVNQNLLSSFASGRDSLSGSECTHIERTMTEEIMPRMIIPLIQALIVNAVEYENPVADNKYSHATVHVLAKALIPLVKEVSTSSALTLANAYGSFQQISPGQSAQPVVDALASIIRPLGLSCIEIGILNGDPNWAKCGPNGGIDADGDGDAGGDGERDNDTIPVPETPTNLGDNLYVTSTFVKDKAKVGLDIRDMEKQLTAGNTNTAKSIYENGENSEIFDTDGKFVALRTLRSFSLESSKDMVEEPLFNMFLYTLRDNDGNFKQIDAKEYANSYVEYAFQNIVASDKTLPAEAAVSLNVWMEIVHQLYRALSLCEQKELRDEEGIQSMDIAAAYWIGESLDSEDGIKGHLLYALAENMGSRFNIVEGGQSRTNRNVLRLFNEAKTALSLPNACSENPATYVNLRHTVNKIVSVISIPLVQSLIHYLRANDVERVKLYAHAVIPLVAKCNQPTFEYLRDRLLSGNYNAIEIEKVVDKIRSVYSCLGLKCDDIGIYSSEVTDEAPSCIDEGVRVNLAGYTPANDVSDYSRIDLDLREIDILMQMNAYKAAEETYMYGKNVENPNGGALSVSNIATTSGRSIVPQYDAFTRFYDDKSYVDKIIRAALRGDGIWSGEQRRVLVLKAAQTIVMYFGALQAAFEAVSDCSSTVQARSSTTKSDAWDRAAAYLIGSLEGSEAFGTPEGYLFHSLAQEHCEAFGTCASSTGAVDVNNQLIDLLYAGRGAVLSGSCPGLQKVAGELSSLILVPSIQGALVTAIRLTESNTATAPMRRAEGYVYSRALLPLVDDVNRDAAGVIEKNLGDRMPAKGTQIASEVFSAFSSVYPGLRVDCELIGHIDGFDPCSGVSKDTESSSFGSILLWIGVGAGVLFLLGALIFFCLKKQGKESLPENNPKFVVSAGEFNNHSMNLLEKAFTNNRTAPSSPEETNRLTGATDPSIDIISDDDDDFDEAQALKSRLDSTPDII